MTFRWTCRACGYEDNRGFDQRCWRCGKDYHLRGNSVTAPAEYYTTVHMHRGRWFETQEQAIAFAEETIHDGEEIAVVKGPIAVFPKDEGTFTPASRLATVEVIKKRKSRR